MELALISKAKRVQRYGHPKPRLGPCLSCRACVGLGQDPEGRQPSLAFLPGPESPRYQNFYKGSRRESDAAYVDPIPTDYYNWGCFQKPPEDNDSNSYENVLICKPSTPESGTEESEDYQNSVSILQWRESKRTMGARTSPSGSPDEEPDYVNGDVATTEKI